MSADRDRDELLAGIDLGDFLVELTRIECRGFAYPCPNPQHDQTGKTPPVTLSPSGGYQVFKCHGCGAAGTAVDALMYARGIPVGDAMRELGQRQPGARRRPQPVREPAPLPTEAQVAEWARRLLERPALLERLRELRGWTQEAIEALGVGFDGKRITIPVRDRTGALVNVLRYTPSPKDDAPKLIALRGRPRDLVPAPGTLQGGDVWIVEGEPDAIAAHSLGLAAVAIPGVEFAKRLDPERFRAFDRAIVLLDCDQPGRDAAGAIAQTLANAGNKVKAIDLDPSRDDGYDLGDLAREAAADGSAGLAQARKLLERMAQETQPTRAESDWPTLSAHTLPPFPVDALPPAAAEWVERTALHTQTPADLPALAALGVLSAAALGGSIVDCGSWQEELGLYLLVAMPSGDRKSTVLRAAVAPLIEIERERQEVAAPRVRELCSRREILETRKRRLTKIAADSQELTERAQAESELAEIGAELDSIGGPVLPRLLANDATPEALGGLLAEHGSISVIAAESAFIDNLAGRYSDGKANLHLVCGAYSGEPHTIDRRGHDPAQISRPLVSITLTVQPHVLEALVSHPIARAQGLVARFAYAVPETRLGRRQVDAPEVPQDVEEAWAAVVRRVAKSADKTDRTAETGGFVSSVSNFQPVRITLTAEARALLSSLQTENEPRLAPGAELHEIADWAGRHHGRVARIAAVLHLCGHDPAEPISGDTMGAACKIGSYLLQHGTAALLGPTPNLRAALNWLQRHGAATVTQRDLLRGPLGSRGTADDAKQLDDQLATLGVLRQIETPAPGEQGGRPSSPAYEIHPGLRRPAQVTEERRAA
jgi:DNA primase